MSVLVNSETKLLVQGITGEAARHHTEVMMNYGTHIVAGMRPGAGGTEVHGIPVYDTAAEAAAAKKPDASILFVPAKAMKQAAFEALEANIKLVVMVSEHVPLHDTMEIAAKAEETGAEAGAEETGAEAGAEAGAGETGAKAGAEEAGFETGHG